MVVRASEMGGRKSYVRTQIPLLPTKINRFPTILFYLRLTGLCRTYERDDSSSIFLAQLTP